MKIQPIGSREYKTMLAAAAFDGNEKDLKRRAEDCWDTFCAAIKDAVIKTDKTLDKIDKRRTIQFHELGNEHRLRANDYVFRERIDLDQYQAEFLNRSPRPFNS